MCFIELKTKEPCHLKTFAKSENLHEFNNLDENNQLKLNLRLGMVIRTISMNRCGRVRDGFSSGRTFCIVY